MTPEEIAKVYSGLLLSVDSINEAIATADKDQETLDYVRRNKEHLEMTLAHDYWTTEDMTSVNQAISDGNAYLA